jgi:hypothetical protein
MGAVAPANRGRIQIPLYVAGLFVKVVRPLSLRFHL